MKKILVKTLMVPIEEYATVSIDATLSDAVLALERAQQAYDCTRYRHRAILVLDRQNRPVGKISQLDALRALEPKYKELQGEDAGNTFRHFSRMFIKSMLQHHRLFDHPLDDLRNRAATLFVKDFMYAISETDCLNENATLDEAIHILIMGPHQSLLVTRQEQIIGVLRLTDVFAAVFHSLSVPTQVDQRREKP